MRTIKKLFEDATGDDFPINNVISVEFGSFRRAVNYIGGVYVDIDRDYFNDNSGGGERYATIDINPGYQKLKGQDALDYVRYRHTDNDFIRAARQQDFLRQARNMSGVRKLFSVGDRKRLAKVFGRYFTVDKSFRSNKEIFSMLGSPCTWCRRTRASTRSGSAPTTRRTRRSTRSSTPRPRTSRRPSASS